MKDRETRQRNRREKRTDEKLTLNTKLVLVIAGSLLLAVGLFFVWLKTTVYIIDKKYLDETVTARRTDEKIDRFAESFPARQPSISSISFSNVSAISRH